MSRESHMQKLADAKLAVDRLHGDTTVDRDTTLESLQEFREVVSGYIDALEEDTNDE